MWLSDSFTGFFGGAYHRSVSVSDIQDHWMRQTERERAVKFNKWETEAWRDYHVTCLRPHTKLGVYLPLKINRSWMPNSPPESVAESWTKPTSAQPQASDLAATSSFPSPRDNIYKDHFSMYQTLELKLAKVAWDLSCLQVVRTSLLWVISNSRVTPVPQKCTDSVLTPKVEWYLLYWIPNRNFLQQEIFLWDFPFKYWSSLTLPS